MMNPLSRSELIEELKNIFHGDFLVLDTETTGLDSNAEIIEIGIVDKDSNVIFDSLIKPVNSIPEEATVIHGITNEMVKNSPSYKEIYGELKSIVNGKTLIIYNADYDLRLLDQTAEINGISNEFNFKCLCFMKAYAHYYGETKPDGEWRWQRLTNAVGHYGITVENAHRAIGDCQMTLQLFNAVIKENM